MSVPEDFTLYLNSILNADPENIYIELVMSGPFSIELLQWVFQSRISQKV